MTKFTKEQVGVSVSEAELVSLLNDQHRGGFCYIHGYTSENGEVAHHWFKGACIYPNMVSRSVGMIDDGSLLSKLASDGLTVTRGVWVDGDGVQHNRKAKGRVYQTITKTYGMDNAEDAAKVAEALASLRNGLVSPKTVEQGFTSIAKGAYAKADQPAGVVYFRDCMTVSKFVTEQGEYEQKASDEIPAVKEALRRLLPVGKYRAYKLAGNFDYISIGGQAILQGSNLGEWDMAVALKEAVKEAVSVPVAAQLADSIMEG